MKVGKIITVVCTMTILAYSITAPVPVMYELTQKAKLPALAITHPDLEVISSQNITRLEQLSTWGEGNNYDLDVSPDKSTIAVHRLDGIHLLDSVTLEEKQFIDRGYAVPGDAALTVKFTPDGSHLALSIDTDVSLFNLTTQKTDQYFLSQIPDFNVADIQITPDNRFAIIKTQGWSYACEGGMNNYALYDLSTSSFERVYDRFLCGYFSYTESRLTADNKAYFFYWSGESNYPMWMDVVDLSGNFPVERVKYGYDTYDPLKTFYDVSPNGQWLASLEVNSNGGMTSHIVSRTGDILDTVDGIVTFDSELQDGKPVWRNRGGFPDIPEISKCEAFDNTHGYLQKITSRGDLTSFLIDLKENPKSVELWDTARCERIKSISGDRSEKLMFSPDGKWLATQNGDNLDVRETGSGRVQFTVESGIFREPVDMYAFSRNSEVLFTGTEELEQYSGTCVEQPRDTNFINVWDTRTGEKIKSIKSDKHYLRGIYTGNNLDIVAITDKELLNFYQVSSGQLLSSLPSGKFVFSNTGDYVWLIGQEKGEDPRLSLYDIWTGRKIRELHLPYFSINGFTMNEDNSRVAILTYDLAMKMSYLITLDGYTGTELHRTDLDNDTSYDLTSLGNLFSISGNNGFVDLWDYKDGSPLQHFYGFHTIEKVVFPGTIFQYPTNPIDGLKISPARDYLLTFKGSLRFWDTKTGNLLGEVKPNFTLPYGNSSIAFSPDGRLIALAGTDGIIRIWGVPKEVSQ